MRGLQRWLGETYYREFDATTKSEAYQKPGVPMYVLRAAGRM